MSHPVGTVLLMDEDLFLQNDRVVCIDHLDPLSDADRINEDTVDADELSCELCFFAPETIAIRAEAA